MSADRTVPGAAIDRASRRSGEAIQGSPGMKGAEPASLGEKTGPAAGPASIGEKTGPVAEPASSGGASPAPSAADTKGPEGGAAAAGSRIPVLEIFGPTVQGEGMVIGQKTMFVRTAGCDYSCSWCDSAFTWDGSAKEEIRLLTPEQVVRQLGEIGGGMPGHVTLSGGNPALLRQLGELIELLHEGGAEVALETQGSRWQDWFVHVDELTISPKPPSSGMKTDWDALDQIVRRLLDAGRRFSLKVVIFDEEDLRYAAGVKERYPEVPFFLQSGNDRLQEPDTGELLAHLRQRYEWLVDRVMSDPAWRRVRVLPQLHAWMWGNKRGV